MKGQRAIHKRS